jgi:hypothetical protein
MNTKYKGGSEDIKVANNNTRAFSPSASQALYTTKCEISKHTKCTVRGV